ncbi:hypothetical protein CSOJ01_15053 [Colletotrichum sojae]|uniref:Uncharacterized protein n=1 Tax=Colletotrichum sojae TaxID=2175907 RepID=A0A8H6IP50_9PEZI|nr:hypothetical protein CSOJ01_15053 [Colletotrichum sojae]
MATKPEKQITRKLLTVTDVWFNVVFRRTPHRVYTEREPPPQPSRRGVPMRIGGEAGFLEVSGKSTRFATSPVTKSPDTGAAHNTHKLSRLYT